MNLYENEIEKLYMKYCGDMMAEGYGETEAEIRSVHRIAIDKGLDCRSVADMLARMGYAVEGLFPDGKSFTTPYIFRNGSLKDDESFILPGDCFFECVSEDAELKEELESRRLVYVDGHLCVNSPKYVSYSGWRPNLTDYALQNMDECAAKFRHERVCADTLLLPYLERTAGDFKDSITRCVYVHNLVRGHESVYRDAIVLNEVQPDIVKLEHELDKLGSDKVVGFIVRDVMGCVLKDMEIDIGIAEGMMSNYISGKRKPRKTVLIAMCLYMRLPPDITFKIIGLMGYSFNKNNKEDRTYCDYIMTWWYWGDITEINNLLRKQGVKPLTNT